MKRTGKTNPDFWDGEIPFYTPKDATDSIWVADCERTITEAGLNNCNSRLFPKETVFITARGTVEERIEGLYSGADDYLAKPCDLDEVVARIHALVRRAGVRPGTIQVGDLTLDMLRRDARRAGRRIELTEREFFLLEALARSAGTPLTRMQLLERVFGYRVNPGTNVIEVHIKNLRKKVDADFEHPLIHTVVKVGYVLREGPAAG